MKLRPYQTKMVVDIDDAWVRGAQNVLGRLATGGGKCLGKGTPILMFDGSVRAVEDVVVGDSLMGPDSQPRRVLSLARGREMMYRVTPTKGADYVVNESHILSVKISGTKDLLSPAGGRYTSGEVCNLPVTDYLRAPATFKHRAKGWRTGVEFGAREVHPFLPPYMLGLWLGDGTNAQPHFSTVDFEVVDSIIEYAATHGMNVWPNFSKPCPTYCLIAGPHERRSTRNRPNDFANALDCFRLRGNKHVPALYRCNSREVRLEVLAGIVDTDGYLGHTGYDLIFKERALADDVAYLARSLGLAAYVRECVKGIKSLGFSGVYNRVSISGDVEMIPCRVARRIAPPRRQKKDVLVTGITVAPIGEDDYFGFNIDGDNLFMLGDFTVTHNTPVLGEIVSQQAAGSCVIAHRSELVSQASVALALYGVRHRVIGSPELSRVCSQLHLSNPDIGRDYISPNAKCAVASVNTIVRRDAENSWFKSVGLWVVDEGHHLQATNVWGRAVSMFRDTARGLAMTATPGRPDGKGLGRNNDGLIDAMVAGPEMAALTRSGYLTPLKIYVPYSDVDYSSVPTTASGELSAPRLSAVVHANKQFVGNTVDHYLTLAPGKLGVTFCVDVEAAVETAREYRARGVPAEVIDANTPPALRATIMRRFRAREIMQLVNVDILGEGVDVPAVEVVSMARRTASLIVYRQQAGRAVRLLLPVALRGAWDTYTDEQRRAFIASSSKPFGILIDQVGNVGLHGKPDCHVDWSLDRREKGSRGTAPNDVEANRTCLNKDVGRDGSMIPCMFSYSRILGPECPECGFVHVPARRDGPEYVDGHLVELDPAVLDDLTEAVADVHAAYPPVEVFHVNPRMPPMGQAAAMKRHFQQHEMGAAEHTARQMAQAELRPVMATWGGWRAHEGDDEATMQRRFFHSFGVDVLTAQALGSVEAVALIGRIRAVLTRENILIDETVNSV